MKIKNVPNLLSAIRLLLVPVFVYFFLTENTGAAVAVFILSGITDILDGYIARKYGCTSTLGKVLDPLADKITQFSAFICLYITHIVPLWMPVVYFIKELATAIGALFVFKKGKRVVKSHVFGKLATFFVYAFVSVVILLGSVISYEIIVALCIFMCLYFVFSCLMYVKTEVNREVAKIRTRSNV